MKILFGVVNDLKEANSVSLKLFAAIETGNVKIARKLILQLIQLTTIEHRIYLTEHEWFDVLRILRKNEKFQANYILSQEQIKFMYLHRENFPEALKALTEKAHHDKHCLLELPIDED